MQQNFVRKEFFFHTAKYGPDFFFNLELAKFCCCKLSLKMNWSVC